MATNGDYKKAIWIISPFEDFLLQFPFENID